MLYWRNTKDRRKLVVVKGTTIQINQPHSLAELTSIRSHEEADTVIPLQVIDAIGDSSLRGIDVWSPDTNTLIWTLWLIDEFVHSLSSVSSLEKATRIDRSPFERVTVFG